MKIFKKNHFLASYLLKKFCKLLGSFSKVHGCALSILETAWTFYKLFPCLLREFSLRMVCLTDDSMQRCKIYIVLQLNTINIFISLEQNYNIFIEIRQILSELYNILRKKILQNRTKISCRTRSVQVEQRTYIS